MKPRRSFQWGLFVAFCGAFGTPACGDARPQSAGQGGKVHSEVAAALGTGGAVRVIVNFRDPLGAPPALGRILEGDPATAVRNSLEQHRQAIGQAANEIAFRHRTGFQVLRSFQHLSSVAGYASASEIEQLAHDPAVTSVQLDHPGGGALRVAVPAIGGDKAQAMFGVTGQGVLVAVLDSGVNTTHVDLADSILPTQHCFTQGACPPANTSEGTSAEDDNGHGSNVTGIITSNGIAAGVGFAPGADILAVKIDDSAGRGFTSDWAAGLDWVFANLATFKVRIVNMSIVTDAQYDSEAACDAAEPALAQAVKNLSDAGVVLFAAAGNNGSTTGIDAPACLTGVIAVGATYKSAQGPEPAAGVTFQQEFGAEFSACSDSTSVFDEITCFTNSTDRVDMVAPGAVIISDYIGSTTALLGYTGTSQATPAAAGVTALMLQCHPSLTPAQIKSGLQETGVPDTDAKDGRVFPSIRALAAIQSACGSPDAGVPADGGAGHTGTAGAGGAGMAGAGGTVAANGGATGTAGGGSGGSSGGAGGAPGGSGTAGAGGVAGGAAGAGTAGKGGAAGATGGTEPTGSGGTGGAEPTGSGGTEPTGAGGGGGGVATGGGGSPGGSGGAAGRHGGGGAGGASAAGSGGGGHAGAPVPPSNGSGCSCDLPSGGGLGSPNALWIGLFVAALLVRRRSRRSRLSAVSG
jgi:subtilisin family serine protease